MVSRDVLSFAAATSIYYAVAYATAYFCGKLVDHYRLKVNYTRKINHAVTIGLPFILQQLFQLDQSMLAVALAAIATPAALLIYIRPIRSRSKIVASMFRSFDRPEDRPHTLTWLITQYVAVYAVYVMIYPVLIERGVVAWMFVPIVVNAVGDGLAEPVGVAWGRHHYSCAALFTRRRYQRTLEGSACVLLSAVAAIWMYRASFSETQYIAALVVVPISSAVAEAISPHTWDAPFLFLVVGLEMLVLSFV